MEWFRWYHGTTRDPKWRVIAEKAGTSIPNVIAIWAALLENASESDKRGTLSEWNHEDVAACFNVTVETVETVCNAMQQKTLEGNVVRRFTKRNPIRERVDSSTDRVRAFRERKRHETPGNAEKHPDKSREEEIREEKKEKGNTARKTRAPSELPVTDAMRQWARDKEITVNLDAETQAMLDYHTGKGSLQLDWVATWRTWMRNAMRFAKPNGRDLSHGKPTETEIRAAQARVDAAREKRPNA